MTEPLLQHHARVFAGLVPLVFLLSMACTRSIEPRRSETRTIDPYALQIDLPAGWTGGGAGGTYEFHSPDGQSRLRVGRLESMANVSALKDAQLLAGTGAQSMARVVAPSPTKVGALAAVRARLAGSDQRIYEVLAVQVPTAGVVLVQASITTEAASSSSAISDDLFASFRQSLKYTGPAPTLH